jgi:hypothetical protein
MRSVLVAAVVVMAASSGRRGWGQTDPAPPPVRLSAQLGFGVLTPVDSIGSKHNEGDLAGELSVRAAYPSGWQPHLRVIWGSVVPAGLPPVGVRLWALGVSKRWQAKSWVIPYLGGGLGLYSTSFVNRVAVSADAGAELPLGKRISLVANGTYDLAFTGSVKPQLLTLTIGAQLSTN